MSAADVWDGTKWTGSDGKTEYTAGSWLRNANIYAARAWQESQAVRAEVTALRSVVEQLATALAKGGSSVDTAAILAGVDQRLAAVKEQVADELSARLQS